MKCVRCGKSGIFLKLSPRGFCPECEHIVQLEQSNYELSQNILYLQGTLNNLGFTEYSQTKAAIDKMNVDMAELNVEIEGQQERRESLLAECEKLDRQIKAQTNKLERQKNIYKPISYAIKEFKPLTDWAEQEIEAMTVVKLPFHCMDIRDLRKAFRKNEKQINSLLEQYESRYTTKAYRSLYHLMVLSLRAELQNILFALKFEKLDEAIDQVKAMTSKYLAIVSDGNQNIAGTMTRFIGEIEYLFIEAVKIEYNYYVKKEQARQEQLAIREKMRQEAEERKALEEEKRKVEAEEKKYHNELEKLKIKMEDACDEEKEALRAKILELQAQLSDVAVKKERLIA